MGRQRIDMPRSRADRVNESFLPSYNGNGLRNGIDLDDSASLLRVMEEGD